MRQHSTWKGTDQEKEQSIIKASLTEEMGNHATKFVQFHHRPPFPRPIYGIPLSRLYTTAQIHRPIIRETRVPAFEAQQAALSISTDFRVDHPRRCRRFRGWWLCHSQLQLSE